LDDISKIAREAGFNYPVAVTSRIFHEVLNPTTQLKRDFAQSYEGRAWDMLMILRVAIRKSKGGDRVDFAPLFIMPGDTTQHPRPVKMYSMCGPGDDERPVITILLEGED